MKLTPPRKNKTTPIKAGIKIVESKTGYDNRMNRFPLNNPMSEFMVNNREGTNKEIEITTDVIKSFLEICLVNGFR